MGIDRAVALLVVCHTYREENETSARIRIISARRARSAEVKQYRGNKL